MCPCISSWDTPTITKPCPHPSVQTELQHLASGAVVAPCRRVAETDPLLLDQVYSCTSSQQQQSSTLDIPNSSSPAAKGATRTQAAATRQSANSFTRCVCVCACVCRCWACTCQHAVGEQYSLLSCCCAVV